MVKAKPVIHIGYPKSASTTLQKQLFNRHPGINNLGLFPTANLGIDSGYIDTSCPYLADENLRKFYHNLVMLRGIEYKYSGNLGLFEEYIAGYLEDERVSVFSNERFTSVFYSHPDVAAKANRLKEIFPRAKILLVIRNQLDLIKSQYRDHPFDPRNFAIGKPVSLDKWIEIAYKADEVYFLSSLKYYEVAGYYAGLFGKDNIGIFLLEDLASNVEQFSEAISSFIGVDSQITLELLQGKRENRGVSHRYNVYRKIRRRAFSSVGVGRIVPEPLKEYLLTLESRLSNVLKQGSKRNYSMSQPWVNRLTKYYAESNSNLQREYDIDLSHHDYP
jgi:hypothetical protein